MKIAIFSDIHGNLEALSAILSTITKKQYDEILCLGDLVSMGPNSKECLDLLRKNNARLLQGNHERYVLFGCPNLSYEEQDHQSWVRSQLSQEDLSYLAACPLFYCVNDILFEHFLIQDINQIHPFLSLNDEDNIFAKVKKTSAKLIFTGHQHKPFLADKMVCIGSSGCRKNDETFFYIVDTENLSYEKIILNYDRLSFEKKIKSSNYPGIEFISRVIFGIK